ncbi:MAG: hypothetical protein AAGF20_00075 [Pseudomonadota bacterium]
MSETNRTAPRYAAQTPEGEQLLTAEEMRVLLDELLNGTEAWSIPSILTRLDALEAS